MRKFIKTTYLYLYTELTCIIDCFIFSRYLIQFRVIFFRHSYCCCTHFTPSSVFTFFPISKGPLPEHLHLDILLYPSPIFLCIYLPAPPPWRPISHFLFCHLIILICPPFTFLCMYLLSSLKNCLFFPFPWSDYLYPAIPLSTASQSSYPGNHHILLVPCCLGS